MLFVFRTKSPSFKLSLYFILIDHCDIDQGPEAGQYGDLQREMLHFLRQPAPELQGGGQFLQPARRLSGGRVQPRPPGVPLLGAVAATQR